MRTALFIKIAPPAEPVQGVPPKPVLGLEGVMSRVRSVLLMPTTIIAGMRPLPDSKLTAALVSPKLFSAS
jgi:hypothetical protein